MNHYTYASTASLLLRIRQFRVAHTMPGAGESVCFLPASIVLPRVRRVTTMKIDFRTLRHHAGTAFFSVEHRRTRLKDRRWKPAQRTESVLLNAMLPSSLRCVANDYLTVDLAPGMLLKGHKFSSILLARFPSQNATPVTVELGPQEYRGEPAEVGPQKFSRDG